MLDKPKKPIFFAIKVSVNKSKFKKYIMQDSFMHHVTIAYKPEQDIKELMLNLVGNKKTLKAKYILKKDNVGSVLVFDDIPEYFELTEPHLTISTNGQAPAVSNEIIKEYNADPNCGIKCIPVDMELSGKICGVVYGKSGATYVSDRRWLKT
jgi:2'-5' RNA ligase